MAQLAPLHLRSRQDEDLRFPKPGEVLETVVADWAAVQHYDAHIFESRHKIGEPSVFNRTIAKPNLDSLRHPAAGKRRPSNGTVDHIKILEVFQPFKLPKSLVRCFRLNGQHRQAF